MRSGPEIPLLEVRLGQGGCDGGAWTYERQVARLADPSEIRLRHGGPMIQEM